ncbi:MipA/OmpV family protein [Phenylobacterium sp.]|uniref:MipA/OmpV family protein n=1 Tax=Phenylobacterium sp. TaxID=1871053 RepID=UPI0025F57991|nr:MipA/OmpV family protein [Phenylobacterium sp.]MCA6227701.1 MipA/OmpV family protein [Phenylobacterium sp.]
MTRSRPFRPFPTAAAVTLVLAAGGPALADPSLPPPPAMPLPPGDLVVDLGLAARWVPSYPGASDMALRARPLFGLERLTLPRVGVVADGPAEGAFIYPSVRVEGERRTSDHPELAGMRDVDWALGLGLGAGVNRGSWRAFAEVRAGVTGYSGLTARAGADLLWTPSPKTVMAIGPRIDLAGRDYARTWFGVTPAEAAASVGKLTAYAPDGGLASAGLAASWGRAINDRAMLQVEAGWDRRLGDFEKSPLVRRGERDAVFISTGVTWRFAFGGS